ncbi:hypothetical protein [Motilimonas eburnea]|uniref:hypothetical protein n=1 Tax=Motilimonas eburnea TaxID=1737488 RepID=UPI001E4198B1|nr:hypothetical protein [Motilimonas eburnea]MCE2571827.1 hypothetical protein [Motilimonas eburnea]
MIPKDRMPEAEVTLRLAMYLIRGSYTNDDVICAIDGAQVKVGSNIVFPIIEFLNAEGWIGLEQDEKWQCKFINKDFSQGIIIHSTPGEGDLVSNLINGYTLRVESKKGPMVSKPGSKEYPLIREAIGQLMTVEHANGEDILAVAIPESPKFLDLARQWRERPLMKHTGIHIITVNRHNQITGLESIGM